VVEVPRGRAIEIVGADYAGETEVEGEHDVGLEEKTPDPSPHLALVGGDDGVVIGIPGISFSFRKRVVIAGWGKVGVSTLYYTQRGL